MASGFGTTGQIGRCYPLWMDFSKCLTDADSRSACAALRDDYLECLHHRKEVRFSDVCGTQCPSLSLSLSPCDRVLDTHLHPRGRPLCVGGSCVLSFCLTRRLPGTSQYNRINVINRERIRVAKAEGAQAKAVRMPSCALLLTCRGHCRTDADKHHFHTGFRPQMVRHASSRGAGGSLSFGREFIFTAYQSGSGVIHDGGRAVCRACIRGGVDSMPLPWGSEQFEQCSQSRAWREMFVSLRASLHPRVSIFRGHDKEHIRLLRLGLLLFVS